MNCLWSTLFVGIHGLKPCDAANNMLEAIISFTQTNIKYLKLVRIVIFEQKMKESFKESLEKVASPPVFSSSHRTNTGERGKLLSIIDKITCGGWGIFIKLIALCATKAVPR